MNGCIKKCAKDPLFQWVFLFLCLFSFCGLAFHFLAYSPAVKERSSLDKKLSDVSARYFYQKRLSSELDKVEGIQNKISELSSKLERGFSSVGFSSDMEKFVADSGVQVIAQSYSPPRVREQFSTVDINVRVAADYKKVRKFLGLLEGSRFFLIIDKARLELRDSKVLGDLELKVRYLGGPSDN